MTVQPRKFQEFQNFITCSGSDYHDTTSDFRVPCAFSLTEELSKRGLLLVITLFVNRVEGTATIPSFPLPLPKRLGKQRIKPQTPKLISLVILNSSRSL